MDRKKIPKFDLHTNPFVQAMHGKGRKPNHSFYSYVQCSEETGYSIRDWVE